MKCKQTKDICWSNDDSLENKIPTLSDPLKVLDNIFYSEEDKVEEETDKIQEVNYKATVECSTEGISLY